MLVCDREVRDKVAVDVTGCNRRRPLPHVAATRQRRTKLAIATAGENADLAGYTLGAEIGDCNIRQAIVRHVGDRNRHRPLAGRVR